MLKDIKKILNKEFKKRYEVLEDQYLGLEHRLYNNLEDRISTIEDKFDLISDLLKEEIRSRKERNEQKMEDSKPETTYSDSSNATISEDSTPEVQADDLTKINGIGNKMAKKLEQEGIISFGQLANLSTEQIEHLSTNVKNFAERYHKKNWAEQAQELA